MYQSFGILASELEERIMELRRLAQLRIEDGAKGSFTKDLIGLETGVRAVEDQVALLRSRIKEEFESIPKVEALLEACRQQNDHIENVASNMPARLPRAGTSSVQGAVLPAGRSAGLHGPATVDASKQGARSDEAPAPAASGQAGAQEGAGRRRKEPPRWYVSESELNSTESYMRNRLQLDKVNGALDELVSLAVINHKLLASYKAGANKLPAADRKRANDLIHDVAAKDGIRGHFWFLDTDLRGGPVKYDNTGKSILNLLRHLGRLKEVRVNVDGVATVVYVLQEDSRRVVL